MQTKSKHKLRGMKTTKYKLKIKGLKTPSGTISLIALKELSEILIESSEKALRLIVEGTSTKKGQIPIWLRESLNFNVTGIKEGSTVLEIEAPQLITTAQEKIAQLDLWSIIPNPKDTALTVWGRSYKDAINEKYESELLDRGLLNSFISFKEFIDRHAEAIELNSRTDKIISKVGLSVKQLTKVEKLILATPEPKVVMLSGLFNIIEHLTSRFTLNLEIGEKIQGEFDRSVLNPEEMRKYWGSKVTLRGLADFKPNGKIRYIRTDLIKRFEEKETLFNTYIAETHPRLFVEEIKQKFQRHSPLQDVWNKWPGNESIEEILSQLD